MNGEFYSETMDYPNPLVHLPDTVVEMPWNARPGQIVEMPESSLTVEPINRSNWPARAATLGDVLRHGLPGPGLPRQVQEWRRANWPNLLRGLRRVWAAKALGVPTIYGQLWLTVIRADGRVEEMGLASARVVTNAGVNYIVDSFQNLVELELMKFHGLGTNATAEAAADTALGAELTTAYVPDSTRATGSLAEGASANVFRTVGVNTVDAAAAVTEHGIFTQAATGGGTLLDRSVFSVQNLASGDSLQTTYDFTVTSGG